ncbi:hypothetical protein R5R35_011302 [Gryllus longicercus]|uniref:Chitin-binding type-2 domain-containing protein n=1 Tax=Gryllus longicercus TaxID=2509291 RepID=A0AAN9VX90_9ORTH
MAQRAALRRLLLLAALLAGPAAAQFRCPEKSGYFPDPEQCDLYYKCTQSEPEEKLCPDGLVFDDTNPSQGRCDLPANVDCGDRTELQEPKPSPGCPRANGVFRHSDPEVCDKFVNCVDGEPNELPCPPGLIFDDSTSNCAWTTESQRHDCTNSKKDVLNDGFSCPDGEVIGPNGRPLPHPTFPHPDDCQKFYICRNGRVPQPGNCPADTVYNEATFRCDEPENVPGCEKWFDDVGKRNRRK